MTTVKAVIPMLFTLAVLAGCATTTATPTMTATTQATATTSAAWPTIPLGHACDLRGPSSMNQAVFWPQVGGSIRA
jgi:hypothetical protein